MADRKGVRVGRAVTYRPTSSEATTGGDSAGALWRAFVTKVNADGTANLHVLEADGTTIAKTNVVKGEGTGQFSLIGLGPKAP